METWALPGSKSPQDVVSRGLIFEHPRLPFVHHGEPGIDPSHKGVLPQQSRAEAVDGVDGCALELTLLLLPEGCSVRVATGLLLALLPYPLFEFPRGLLGKGHADNLRNSSAPPPQELQVALDKNVGLARPGPRGEEDVLVEVGLRLSTGAVVTSHLLFSSRGTG